MIPIYVQAKYAYKSIAEFAKHVIDHPHANEAHSVFPEMKVENDKKREENDSPDCTEAQGTAEHLLQAASAFGNGVKEISASVGSRAGLSSESKSSQQLFEENKASAKENIQEQAELNRVEDVDSDQDEDEPQEGSRVVRICKTISYLLALLRTHTWKRICFRMSS